MIGLESLALIINSLFEEKKKALFVYPDKSMNPFIRKNDTIILDKASIPFHKYDIVLYKNTDYEFGRIIKIKKDGIFVSLDTSFEKTRIYPSQILAVVRYIKGKQYIDCRNDLNYLIRVYWFIKFSFLRKLFKRKANKNGKKGKNNV